MTNNTSPIRQLVLILFFLSQAVPIIAFSSPAFSPKKGDRIVLLGNTFADRMRHYGYLEVLLQKNYPDLELSVRNMGWSADEVGLQPRPFNFPGITQQSERNAKDSTSNLSFQSWGEVVKMPVALNFEGLHQDLHDKKADIIFLCFGLNEAFKGEEGLEQFEKDYERFISELRSKKYNGRTPPAIILVSPIAHEKLGGQYPDPSVHNKNLSLYTSRIGGIAVKHGLLFIDLYHPSQERMSRLPQERLTINGIHLNDLGYRESARWMGSQLGLKPEVLSFDLLGEEAGRLKKAIRLKDDHFFYKWRAVNGEYIYGRRREPFGVLSYPPEMARLDRMIADLDGIIWQLCRENTQQILEKALSLVDESNNPDAQKEFLVTHMTGRQSKHLSHGDTGHRQHDELLPADPSTFTLPEGYKINLFASEKDFPELAKPVAMAFDTHGRLWVATMPTYPQYIPGVPVHDKLLILDDTDGDGVADTQTVFADDLYLPLGFELGNGGVYVSQEPDLVFLKDTDGDGKADVREVILTGFGTEDSHHAIHTFSYGPDGALYFNEGTFLNSQVETPYGPVRSYEGATYRYEPRTGKLEHYISYPYYNPWGNVFDRWGTHLIGDASDGSNYFASPITGKVGYPDKHPRMNTFTTTRVRPTAGLEVVSSRNFPEEVQGNLLINNNIGFQGIKQHQILEDGAGLTSKEVEPLLQSSDPFFRPVDLEFGPDGALYIVDWYNPLISHGENPPRDPARDKVHGRIWRVTYGDRPLVKNPAIPGKSSSAKDVRNLLDLLKSSEDRYRYRVRYAIREIPAETTLPILERWVKGLKQSDQHYELHLLEALWIYQDFNRINHALLERLLTARDFRARSAAVRTLRHWAGQLQDPLALLERAARDEHPRVRLQAVVALSHFPSERSVSVAGQALNFPTDYFLDYALKETFRQLKPVWWQLFVQQSNIWEENSRVAAYLLGMLSAEELQQLPGTRPVLLARLNNAAVPLKIRESALTQLAGSGEQRVPVLFEIIQSRIKDSLDVTAQVSMLVNQEKDNLRRSENTFRRLVQDARDHQLRSIAYAAILTVATEHRSIPEPVLKSPGSLTAYLDGIALIEDLQLKKDFYEQVKDLAGNRQMSPEVQAAAYRTLFKIPGHEEEKAGLLSGLVSPQSPYLELVHQVASAIPKEELAQHYASPLLEKVLFYAASADEDHRFEPIFNRILSLGEKLAQFRPEKEKQSAINTLKKEATIEMGLAVVPAQMLFDQRELSVQAGRNVSLHFKNPDLMPHNVLILQPGAVDKVGEAADTMADGFEKHFVPDLPEVLFATPLVQAGEEATLHFKAPDIPGEYPFICSFPGHWGMMRGVLKVEERQN